MMPKCLCPHHKAFDKHVCPCGEALTIAVEALEKINKLDPDHVTVKNALRRIEEIGK